ncbi:hypothetical protein CATMIT_01619, partial [Catenibacterium mitsuokai DSM 15897]
ARVVEQARADALPAPLGLEEQHLHLRAGQADETGQAGGVLVDPDLDRVEIDVAHLRAQLGDVGVAEEIVGGAHRALPQFEQLRVIGGLAFADGHDGWVPWKRTRRRKCGAARGDDAGTRTSPPAPQASFRPTRPATISTMLAMRSAVAGSLNSTMPRMTVPTAPMPTQIA